MEHINFTFFTNRLALIFLLSISVFSCTQNPKAEPKPWHHKEVMPQKLKWFLNSDNYTDSNYIGRFQSYYSQFLEEGHTDSALFCLLVYGEMIDQNYLYDTFYLKTAINHLNRFEPNSEVPGELTKLYYYIGSQYESNSDYDLAIDWYNKGIENPLALPKTKIRCKGMLAQIYNELNKPEKALELQLERLNYYEKEKDTVNIGVAYISIAGVYNVLNAHQLALDYSLKAIKYSRLKNDTNTLIPYITNYITYKKNSETEFKITEEILEYQRELNAICASYSRLSPYNEYVRLDINFDIYYKQKNWDSVRSTLNQLHEVNRVLNNPSFIRQTKYLEYRYNSHRGVEIKNTKEMEEIAKNYEERDMLWEARGAFINLYEYERKRQNYEKALDHFDKIYDIEVEWVRANTKGQIYEMDVKYQTEKKNQEILIQAEQLKIKQRNIILLLTTLIIIALSFLVYYLWQKEKSIAEKRKYESQFTQKLMENTEEERMRIAKDLHDSVGHELLSIKNALSNKLQFTEEKIDHILAEVREISRNLFPVMFEEIGLKISVEQLAESIFNTDNLYVSHDVNYIAGTLDVKSELQVYRIIQEALNNTRKYAQAKSAKISIQQTKNFITIEIKDNGKGFDVMEVLKSGKSFGLLAINQRSKALKASVATESNSKGTTISLEIPIKNV
ncbi:MAG: sensor histidine kinase [Bacteroidia bacterium]|nr:sensor histidine kinase [Bacteroidia bacterium]MCF8427887.1 sensor histidine kinase [Bacteroidia bacterium]